MIFQFCNKRVIQVQRFYSCGFWVLIIIFISCIFDFVLKKIQFQAFQDVFMRQITIYHLISYWRLMYAQHTFNRSKFLQQLSSIPLPEGRGKSNKNARVCSLVDDETTSCSRLSLATQLAVPFALLPCVSASASTRSITSTSIGSARYALTQIAI